MNKFFLTVEGEGDCCENDRVDYHNAAVKCIGESPRRPFGPPGVFLNDVQQNVAVGQSHGFSRRVQAIIWSVVHLRLPAPRNRPTIRFPRLLACLGRASFTPSGSRRNRSSMRGVHPKASRNSFGTVICPLVVRRLVFMAKSITSLVLLVKVLPLPPLPTVALPRLFKSQIQPKRGFSGFGGHISPAAYCSLDLLARRSPLGHALKNVMAEIDWLHCVSLALGSHIDWRSFTERSLSGQSCACGTRPRRQL